MSTFDIAIPEKIAAIAKPKIINIGTIAVIKINTPAKVAIIVKILTNSPFKASVTTFDAVTSPFALYATGADSMMPNVTHNAPNTTDIAAVKPDTKNTISATTKTII